MPQQTARPELSGPSTREVLLIAAGAELEECGHAGISLRAVARRAGVSHAAPKHHFEDRAALLTALAAQGFLDLAATLDRVVETEPQPRLAALGQAYVDYGLAHPALFDLMFRPSELHPADAELQHAQAASLVALSSTVEDASASRNMPTETLTLMAWALVHGLVVLTRDDALWVATGLRAQAGPDLAHHVADAFSRLVVVPETERRSCEP